MSIDNLKSDLEGGPTYFESFIKKSGDGIDEELIPKFLWDSYSGGGGYLNGGYLVPHVREERNRFRRRVWQAYYLNFFKVVVDAHVNPLYKTPIQRSFEAGENSNQMRLWDLFGENSDMKGTNFTQFMKKASRYSKIFGKVFVLMDNVESTSVSLADVLMKREVPYLVLITPDRVKSWEVDTFGMIKSITYTELANNKNEKDEAKLNLKTWTREKWTLTDEEGNPIKEGDNTIGAVPIVEFSTVDSEEFIPNSGLIQTAKANFRLFNLVSEIQEIESNQMYPILIVPDSIPSSTTIGTGNGFRIGDGDSMPGYISPSPQPIQVLREGAQQLIGNIFSISGLSFIAGVNNLSAESKKWDFERTESILKDFSLNAQEVEERLGILFELWIGQTIGMSSQYPQQFGISDLTEELQRASDMILNLPLGNAGAAEVAKSYIRKEFFHSSDEVNEAIEDSIDAESKAREEGLSTIEDDTGI